MILIQNLRSAGIILTKASGSKRAWIAVFSFVLYSVVVSAQSLQDVLKANAIEINPADTTLNQKLVDILGSHRIIMVGEMHGTQEPARFVSYVLRQLLKSGRTVNLGLEIPHTQMGEFISSPSVSSLKRSFFFREGFKDGRNSKEWFDLIAAYTGNPYVKLFFFDVDPDANVSSPDSGMYTLVKKAIIQRPQAITVLLGGNIHNRLLPFRYGKTLACYLQADLPPELQPGILSINHQYKFGAMQNYTSAGFGIHKVEPTPSTYSETVPFKRYFSLLKSSTGPYNAVFYTEEVTPASSMDVVK